MRDVRYNPNTLGDRTSVQDAGSSPAISLPEIPLLYKTVSVNKLLMYIDTLDSIRFNWAFQQCRDFRE